METERKKFQESDIDDSRLKYSYLEQLFKFYTVLISKIFKFIRKNKDDKKQKRYLASEYL